LELLEFANSSIQTSLQVPECRIALREQDDAGAPGSDRQDLAPLVQAAIVEPDGAIRGAVEVSTPLGWPISGEQQIFLQAAANVLAAAVRQKRSIEALAAREQQREEHVRLEALGRLAGGIAHDFNNMLTAILGYAELALARDPWCRRDLEEICRAASSAADLVRQLLAIGRRQQLRVRRIDINTSVLSVESMLRRLIGEDIDFICCPADEEVSAVADPAQLDQVIMNLVLNARDAIKTSGKIVVSVARAVIPETTAQLGEAPPPGRYATLSVADTGEGMDETTRRRIFEPFFTTKQSGTGTGLGLATVHGIVHQSGGTIFVRSTPGFGSVFTVYLPLADATDAADHASVVTHERGSEAVLLVDDDAGVIDSLAQMLRRLGYEVVTAGSAPEALRIASSTERPFQALVTDVVMPWMSGPVLAAEIAKVTPGIETLFMSGHSLSVVAQNGLSEERLIQKPFTCREVAARLRRLLDNRSKVDLKRS
jgi:signal transduction histidine kinase/CheY-like chemotaxis protein